MVPKHPDGPRKKRARARRRVKLALVLSVLVASALGLSWTIHEIEPVRTLPGASALASMLNMQKYNPAEMGFNIEDWPELERVFRSGMDAVTLARELSSARMNEAAAAQFTEDWPELAYLLEEG